MNYEYIVTGASSSDRFEDLLNEYGERGWRVISITESRDNWVAVMEREKGEEEEE